ncbi:hypothetical protein MKEN_00106800 [Mycena kentingensis (nom. inval.)]|nr:hypothetical protein MKEN_00106800 [Mycena kentingensis (nom. inval.)]
MPRASTPSSRRRRPLRELPLDSFIVPLDTLPHTATKRPHSPGVLSPAKRRILLAEGGLSVTSKRLKALPVHSDSLLDTLSPAKKLDFGPPKNSPQATPNTPSTPSEPRMTRSARRKASGAVPSPTVVASQVETRIPREPIPVDVHSIHYPGFVVYQDPFIVVSAASPGVLTALGSPEMEQVDDHKENIAPRRRARKSVTAPPTLDSKPYSTTKRRSPRTTPAKTPTRDRSASITPTARRPEVVLTRSTRATPKLAEAERRELRRRMAEEVDEL